MAIELIVYLVWPSYSDEWKKYVTLFEFFISIRVDYVVYDKYFYPIHIKMLNDHQPGGEP